MSRREAVRAIGLGTTTLYLGIGGRASAACEQRLGASLAASHGAEFSPILRDVTGGDENNWTGEFPDTCHAILRDKEAYIAGRGGIPAPTETMPLVIVGGGISGLTAAYLLRKHRPVVIERNPRFGGNSKGESWNGIEYSIGAAYFAYPETGTPLFNFLRDLGLDCHIRRQGEADEVEIGNALRRGFWAGRTDPQHAAQFKKFDAVFADYAASRKGRVYPDIPTYDRAHRKHVDSLDHESFLACVQRLSGGSLSPQLETALELYCWSSFAGSSAEIGAAYGINFFAGDWGDIAVLPAGNASVAEAILDRLVKDLPPTSLRPGSVVVDVDSRSDGALVAYVDPAGDLRSIRARAVIVACPKFIAARILRDIEPERVAAIRKLKYRAYAVANVLLDGPPKKEFYDLFMLGDGKVDMGDVRAAAQRKGTTDVVLANFANSGHAHSVLTLYRPLPYEGGRTEVFAPESFQRFRAEFHDAIRERILPLLGYREKDVAGLRTNRWGHPSLPMTVRQSGSDSLL